MSIFLVRHGDKEGHNFVKCWPIVTKLYMEISWYNTDIVKKCHRNRYNVKVTKFVENTYSLIIRGRHIVEM